MTLFSPLDPNSERITLMRLEQGQDPIRGQHKRHLITVTDFHAIVKLRNTDKPDHYSDNIRYVYKVTLLPSDYYRPEIQKGRFFKYRTDEYLVIGSIIFDKSTNIITCLCYQVEMADILTISEG